MDEKYIYNEDITRTITIPNGVKVIEVYAEAESDAESVVEFISLEVFSNNKIWCSNNTQDYHVSIIGYIGVTPNKQYTLNLESDSRINGNITIDRFYIKYSPEINNKTPTVTDY